MMAAAPIGILLAGGRGRRFDPDGRRNKLLQCLPGAGAGEAVVVASARKLLAVLPSVVAVVPPDDGGVAERLAAAGCTVTVCPEADSGMAASLTHAIRYSLQDERRGAPHAPDAWLVALGDMPFVATSTLAALRDALACGAPIVAPVLGTRRGNPVGFGRMHLEALLALRGEHGARDLLRRCAVTQVPVDDAGILRDIDTPADLQP